MLDRSIIPHKGKLIEIAHALRPIKSFADLGGCWGVNGGYAFHAAEIAGYGLDRGYVVDQHITPMTRQRAEALPKINLVKAMLGSAEAREAVGKVDALIMYDILLHQVSPDWDQFITSWLPHTEMLIIYNQNWLKSDKTIRFIENGLDWFKDNVVYVDEKSLENWFVEHDKFDENQKKLRRDVHNFWQWGITPNDMINLMVKNGFDLLFMKRFGTFSASKPWIVNDGLVFVRSEFR